MTLSDALILVQHGQGTTPLSHPSGGAYPPPNPQFSWQTQLSRCESPFAFSRVNRLLAPEKELCEVTCLGDDAADLKHIQSISLVLFTLPTFPLPELIANPIQILIVPGKPKYGYIDY